MVVPFPLPPLTPARPPQDAGRIGLETAFSALQLRCIVPLAPVGRIVELRFLATLPLALPRPSAMVAVFRNERIGHHYMEILNADNTFLRLETDRKSDEWLSGALHVKVSGDSYA